MRASEPLEPASLLVPGDLSGGLPLPADDALVSTSLSTNQAPDGLAPGDTVIVVLTNPNADSVSSSSPAGVSGSGSSVTGSSVRGTAGTGATSTAGSGTSTAVGGGAIGTVYAIVLPSASNQAGSSGNEIVTLEVPKSDAAAVTTASAAGDVSLAEISTKRQ
jgi:hypothetical protein